MLLSEAVDERLASLLRSGGSKKTVTFYRYWLDDLAGSLMFTELQLVALADLRRWTDGLIDRKLAVRSRIGAVATVKAFFRWCVREELIATDPSVRLEKPKKPKQLPQALDTGDVLALLNAATTTDNPERDVALLTTMVETGARLGEIVAMALRDLHVDDRYILINGKTGERFCFFELATQQSLRAWLKVRPASMGTLFGLGPTGVRLMLKRLAVLAHIDPNLIHPHVFRHTSVVLRIEGGAEAADLMNIYGWSSPAMIKVYGQLATDRMMARSMASSPMARLRPKAE